MKRGTSATLVCILFTWMIVQFFFPFTSPAHCHGHRERDRERQTDRQTDRLGVEASWTATVTAFSRSNKHPTNQEKVEIYTSHILRPPAYRAPTICTSRWFIQFGGFDDDEVFQFTADGVHMKTYEVRKEPSKKWYSHKHHGPGLTYLVGIATKSQRVVWCIDLQPHT